MMTLGPVCAMGVVRDGSTLLPLELGRADATLVAPLGLVERAVCLGVGLLIPVVVGATAFGTGGFCG